MPKKKVQQKGKSKTAAQENDVTFYKSDSDNSDEYITVVDSEINKKYSKRVIESNWSKYDSTLPNLGSDDDGFEYYRADDFNHLLNTASSDCSHFQLSSEKLWKSEENSMPSSSIFNLHLNILSGGLACIPFHERMGLDESVLSAEDELKFKADAVRSIKEYALLREKLCKKSGDEPDVKNSQTLISEKFFKDKLDLNHEENKETYEGELVKIEKKVKDTEKSVSSESGNTKGGTKSKLLFGGNEEDLEDWLDSVLDD